MEKGRGEPVASLDLHNECPGLVVTEAFFRLFASYCGDLELGGQCLVEVTLASDRLISEVHQESHGDPSPTDCIAFPTFFPELGPGVGLLGAFYMGVEEVARNAREQGHGFSQEVGFVLAHGLLHLLGHEDASEVQRQEMFTRQAQLLDHFQEREGGLPELLQLSGES
jgi:probable rRNA maturation factor